MAGDWIKMRHSLLSHPKTVRMMSALKADKFRIVGGLMSVWCLFDTHSEDGRLSGYTLETLDAMAAWDGFSAAMQAVEWLGVEDDGTLVLPRFDTHNGQSAKRRAQDSDRKREVRKLSASEADKKRTREEKRREEKEEKQEIGESPVGDPPPPAEPKAKKPKREKRPDLTFDQWLATIPDDADIVPADDPLAREAHITGVLVAFMGAMWGTLGTEYARGFLEAQLQSMEPDVPHERYTAPRVQ